jgi:hypothetical protein
MVELEIAAGDPIPSYLEAAIQKMKGDGRGGECFIASTEN